MEGRKKMILTLTTLQETTKSQSELYLTKWIGKPK